MRRCSVWVCSNARVVRSVGLRGDVYYVYVQNSVCVEVASLLFVEDAKVASLLCTWTVGARTMVCRGQYARVEKINYFIGFSNRS